MDQKKRLVGIKDLSLKQPSLESCQTGGGEFRLASDFSDRDLSKLVLYLTGVNKSDIFIKLYGLLGKELPIFLALFSGETIRIPKMPYLQRVKNYCTLYNYVISRGDSEDTRKLAAKVFGRRVSHVNSVISKVNKEIAKVNKNKVIYPEEKTT